MLTVAADAPTLWLVDLDDPATRARAEAVALAAADRADLACRRDAGERLLRRRLTRLLLAAVGRCHPDAVAIRRSADGAPVVAAPPGWHLSVAARWPACLIGVAPFRLGVDLERVTAEPLPPDLLTAAERSAPDEAAGRWAAKEAHAKWTGEPRRVDPAVVETTGLPTVRSPWGETRCWRRTWGDHVAAVCV